MELLGCFLAFVSVIFLLVESINAQCQYEQFVEVGRTYYINSPRWPNYYPPGTQCKWLARSAANTKISLNCPTIELPQTQYCSGDVLIVSLTGDPYFNDGKTYCGRGTLNLVSSSNALSIGLSSTSSSSGGRFACEITATAPPPSCDCGWKGGLKISGGQETGVNEYPFMSALFDTSIQSVICGASIISVRYALTAGHCFESRQLGTLSLKVGDHNTKTQGETPYAVDIPIEAVQRHPNYNSRTLVNDIAIVRTIRDIQFSLYVGPICLPFRYPGQSFVGAPVTALGWGFKQFAGQNSDTLQYVQLSVVDNNQCQAKITDRPVTNQQICTFADGGKDACQGDSGGPIAFMDSNSRRLQLIGVISFGKGCGLKVPGVQTRVTSYLDWIMQTTPDAQYCAR